MGLLDPPALTKQAGDVRYGSIDYASANARAGYIPTFTKSSRNPKYLVANLKNMSSIEFPCLIDVQPIFGGVGPYGETKRCYYSTDHQTTSAGIGLFTMSAWDGTWTDQGQVFTDGTGGNQTENPQVLYVPETQTFILYYHQVQATGATASEVGKIATMSLATAQVGDSWAITSVVPNGIYLDTNIQTGGWPGGNGGWGYGRPFRIGRTFYCHARSGGSSDLSFVLAKSKDGFTFRQDPRLLYFAADKMNDPLGRFNPTSHFPDWGSGNVILWRGMRWWIGILLAYQVQYQSTQCAWAVMAPLSADLRKFTDTPTPLFNVNQSWEGAFTGQPAGMGNHRYGLSATVDRLDGKIYLAYLDGQLNMNNDHAQAANFASGIGLAVGQ